MEAVKLFGLTVGSGVVGSCIGNLASRVVTNKYPLPGAAIAGGVFGAAALAPHVVKPLTDYSMSYYESSAYAAISCIAFIIVCIANNKN